MFEDTFFVLAWRCHSICHENTEPTSFQQQPVIAYPHSCSLQAVLPLKVKPPSPTVSLNKSVFRSKEPHLISLIQVPLQEPLLPSKTTEIAATTLVTPLHWEENFRPWKLRRSPTAVTAAFKKGKPFPARHCDSSLQEFIHLNAPVLSFQSFFGVLKSCVITSLPQSDFPSLLLICNNTATH